MMIVKGNGIPLYKQIKKDMLIKINQGYFKNDEMIPTEKRMTEYYKTSRYPLRQAIEELIQEGYLKRIKGKGTVVTTSNVNYDSNLNNQNHKNNKTIGVLLPSISSEHTSDILKGIATVCRENNVMLALEITDDAKKEIQSLDRLIKRNILCNIVFPNETHSELKEFVDKYKNLYICQIDRHIDEIDGDYIGSDNYSGGFCAARHLYQQGYKNVMYVTHGFKVSSGIERYEGFKKGIIHYKLNLLNKLFDEEDCGINSKSLKNYMKEIKANDCIGVFTINDSIAVECYKFFKQNNFQVGKDVGIIGFDNTTLAKSNDIPLTSMAQNGYLIGEAAARLTIGHLNNSKTHIYKQMVPTQLIIRNSCGECERGVS